MHAKVKTVAVKLNRSSFMTTSLERAFISNPLRSSQRIAGERGDLLFRTPEFMRQRAQTLAQCGKLASAKTACREPEARLGIQASPADRWLNGRETAGSVMISTKDSFDLAGLFDFDDLLAWVKIEWP
jgi:hypothetical protein